MEFYSLSTLTWWMQNSLHAKLACLVLVVGYLAQYGFGFTVTLAVEGVDSILTRGVIPARITSTLVYLKQAAVVVI